MELIRRAFPVALFLTLGLTLTRIFLALAESHIYYQPEAGWYSALNFLVILSWAFLIAAGVLRVTSSRFWGVRS